MPSEHRLVDQVEGSIDRFAAELLAILRAEELDDLIALSRHAVAGSTAADPAGGRGTPVRQVRPRLQPERKRPRAWPRCSEEGCSSKMYPPSGANRLCYRHHLAAGGAPTPLLRKKASPMSEPQKKESDAKPKTILRKKSTPSRPKKEPAAPPPEVKGPESQGTAPAKTQRNKALDAAEGLFNFGGEDG